METKPGSETSEWKGLKYLALAAALVATVGPMLLESGLIKNESSLYAILGALVTIAVAVMKYMGVRTKLKSNAVLAEASKSLPSKPQ